MKKTALLFLIILATCRVFAQSNSKATLPAVIYKMDTVQYPNSKYKIAKDARVKELLQKMEGFKVDSDGSIMHQGQPIKKIKINGKNYDGLDMAKMLKKIPAGSVENIEVIDDYGDAANNSFKNPAPDKHLNINIKKDKAVDIKNLLSMQPNPKIEALINRMKNLEVDANGNITHNGKPVTRVNINGNKYAGQDTVIQLSYQPVITIPAVVVDQTQKLPVVHVYTRDVKDALDLAILTTRAEMYYRPAVDDYGDPIPQRLKNRPVFVYDVVSRPDVKVLKSKIVKVKADQ